MKRRNLIRILIALPAVAIVGIVWLTYREMQREKQSIALIAAIERNDAPAVIAALDSGADPNADDFDEKNVSIQQVLADFWDKLRGRTAYPDERNAYHTALFVTIRGHPASDLIDDQPNPIIVEALLVRGANPNVAGRLYFERYAQFLTEPPLSVAVERYELDTVKRLLAHGARVDSKDELGRTALNWAIETHFTEVIPLLKQAVAKDEETKQTVGTK